MNEEQLAPYIDDYGVPCSRWDFPNEYGKVPFLEGGDSCNTASTIIALGGSELLPHTCSTLKLFFKDRFPVRHPTRIPAYWWGAKNRFSRDQLVAYLCAFIETSGVSWLMETQYRLFEAHKLKWFFRTWNTKKNGELSPPDKKPDFTGPEIWGLWLRLRRPWWRKLVLWFCDIETLLGAVHWRLGRADNVTSNHMLVCLTQRKNEPTWISDLAFKITPWDSMIGRWRAHCEATYIPPMASMFRKRYEELR